jgi:hypothetical protein
MEFPSCGKSYLLLRCLECGAGRKNACGHHSLVVKTVCAAWDEDHDSLLRLNAELGILGQSIETKGPIGSHSTILRIYHRSTLHLETNFATNSYTNPRRVVPEAPALRYFQPSAGRLDDPVSPTSVGIAWQPA